MQTRTNFQSKVIIKKRHDIGICQYVQLWLHAYIYIQTYNVNQGAFRNNWLPSNSPSCLSEYLSVSHSLSVSLSFRLSLLQHPTTFSLVLFLPPPPLSLSLYLYLYLSLSNTVHFPSLCIQLNLLTSNYFHAPVIMVSDDRDCIMMMIMISKCSGDCVNRVQEVSGI